MCVVNRSYARQSSLEEQWHIINDTCIWPWCNSSREEHSKRNDSERRTITSTDEPSVTTYVYNIRSTLLLLTLEGRSLDPRRRSLAFPSTSSDCKEDSRSAPSPSIPPEATEVADPRREGSRGVLSDALLLLSIMSSVGIWTRSRHGSSSST